MDDLTAARFWAKVEKTEGCWNWIGAKTRKGYGQMKVSGVTEYAHRLAARMAGLDPQGWTVDHTCHNTSCVRAEHLRLVTSKQNSENLIGAHRDNLSGARGLSWDERNHKWTARVHSHGRRVFKRFASFDDAETWVRVMRLEMFTHNDVDRGV